MAKIRKILLALTLVLAIALTTACSSDTDALKKADSVGGTANSGGKDISIAETVLYEAADVKITATGYEEGWSGPAVKLLVENNSDKNVLVTSDDVSANGYMMPYAALYTEVAAGKKANDTMTLSSTQLEQAGISTVSQLQFILKIQDSENWDAIATSDLISLETSATGVKEPENDSGDTLYDKNDIKIVCKGLKQDDFWDGTIVFYMENNSDQPITVYAENVSVNGFMVSASLWSDLRSDTKIVDGLSLMDLSELDLKSIDDIEQIEFNLRIINSENWNEIDTTEALTLSF